MFTKFLIAFGTAGYLAKHGLDKKSLSTSGAIAAFIVGFCTLFNSLWVFTAMLLFHYLSSSRLTKLKAERKAQLDKDYVVGGERDATQVLCNSAFATIAAVSRELLYSNDKSCVMDDAFSRALIFMALGHYSCCIADTWASEVGILSKQRPILITTQQRVPHGVNGAISMDGTLASAAGGFTMGLLTGVVIFFEGHCQGTTWLYWCPFLGLLTGLSGSIIDSLLGATMQETLYDIKTNQVTNVPGPDVKILCGEPILSNNQVNLVSSAGCAIILGFVGMCMV